MDGWNKRRAREQNEKLNCILRNQVAIMEAIEKGLYTYEHTARYGSEYADNLISRVEETQKIMHRQKGGKQAWGKIKENAIR